MRKSFIIAAIILLSISVFWILSSGVYFVSTDKTAYASGEPVKIRWSELKMSRCSNDASVAIYRQVDNEWNRVTNKLIGFEVTCIDGEFRYPHMPSDVIFCSGELSSNQGEYVWDGKFHGYKGTVDACGSVPDGFNGTLKSYEHINAPAGKYKVKLGGAESFFRIKSTPASKAGNPYENMSITPLNSSEIFFIISFDTSIGLNGSRYIQERMCENGERGDVYPEDYIKYYDIDESFAKDLCIKSSAVKDYDTAKCDDIESDFVKGLCIAEVNLANEPDFCKDSGIAIVKDFCVILELRKRVGYYPTHDYGVITCEGVSDDAIEQYCKEAYKRKE